MPYYLVMDYIVPIYTDDSATSPGGGSHVPLEERKERHSREYMEPRRSYFVHKIDPKCNVRVVVYDFDNARFLIKAPSRARGYEIARALRGILSVVWAVEPRSDRSFFGLHELQRLPHAGWTEHQLINAVGLPSYQHAGFAMDLNSGTVIFPWVMEHLASALMVVLEDAHLGRALEEFLLSRELFYGFMVGSYYSSHFVRERRAMSRGDREKEYLEQRSRYELAFVAAFKGIERFLRTNQVKAKDVERLLDALPYAAMSSGTRYRRYFEVFSGRRKWSTYAEMVRHFLILRNAVAAHSNPEAPADLLMTSDSVYEIQHFAEELFRMALGDLTSAMPKGAITRRRRTWPGNHSPAN